MVTTISMPYLIYHIAPFEGGVGETFGAGDSIHFDARRRRIWILAVGRKSFPHVMIVSQFSNLPYIKEGLLWWIGVVCQSKNVIGGSPIELGKGN